MSTTEESVVNLSHPDRFFIDGKWMQPSTESRIVVTDSATERPFLSVAEAQAADIDRAVGAARRAFDSGPWPRMAHSDRAAYLRRLGAGLVDRGEDVGNIWPRESGVLHRFAVGATGRIAGAYDSYARLADSFPFEEQARPTAGGEFAAIVQEPVGVVAAIVPWNVPLVLLSHKIAPALLAGCTVVVKLSPEAPGEGYVVAEIAEEIGLPPGVLNFVTADREVSELLVRDPRVDKVSFTGSTAVGRRIGAICGERIARCSLELGGKSPAVILDDIDIETVAETLATAECYNSGQICSSLTRVIVSRKRHDALADALGSRFSAVQVGDPFDPGSEMGPMVTERQRDRVLDLVNVGVEDGARLVTGGRRPADLDRGWYVEPTVLADVDNDSTIAREEIFGPVLSVIPAQDEQDAVRLANASSYGLNAAVFTDDVDRARAVAGQLQSGAVGHNAWRTDMGLPFGGVKQSGVGREGGIAGLRLFLETKTIILDGRPAEAEPPTDA